MIVKHVDYLIIGQGLAGTVLSNTLLNSGASAHVVNSFKANSASRIAAGIFNPVTYRKLKMAEFSDFLIPEIFDYYPKFERELNEKFFYPESFLKILTSIEEQNNWQIQSSNQTNNSYMSPNLFKENYSNTIENEFGAGQVLKSGIVKLPKMIDAWAKYLNEIDCISNEPFNHSDLIITDSNIQYKNIVAKKVVFCEGIGIATNPWFNWLPMQQLKGEVLEISAPNLKLTRMVNRGVFVLPLKNGVYKVGATHDWKNVDEKTTNQGRDELTEKLEKIILVPYKITDHHAGLRPATRDRHPYIGVHPEHKNLFVLNGLGSKGVIMIPWLAKTFIKGLENLDWPKEFNINRFIRFYNQKNQ